MSESGVHDLVVVVRKSLLKSPFPVKLTPSYLKTFILSLSMSQAPLHKDLVALDRAHQVVMQQLAFEQTAAWDEDKSEEEKDVILTTVRRKLDLHMAEIRA